MCFVVSPNNYNCDPKDYLSQITMTNRILMKKFEILRGLTKCDTESRREQILLENGASRLARCRVAANPQP